MDYSKTVNLLQTAFPMKADLPIREPQAIARWEQMDLYRRIQKGGQRMPAFEHLQRSDIDMLYAYLTELVHTPDAKALSSHTVSWVRLGEHLVKGTCHICHDAAGPKPSGQALLQGAVPPLRV